MEKREINIDGKKDVNPPKKRKRKSVPKKVMIWSTREKREVNINDDPLSTFNSMNDYI